jgi:hypothetical protein
MAANVQDGSVYDPDPLITIPVRKIVVGGGEYIMQPALTFQYMPGGWSSVLKLLLQCVELVTAELVKEAGGAKRIEVATMMPDESSLVRQ